jgi:hypothetical protein
MYETPAQHRIRTDSFIGYLRLKNSLFKGELLHQMIGGVGVRCGGSMSALCGDRTLAEKERLLQLSKKRAVAQ